MRWFVGDVQGCVRSLERLLREIRFDPSLDELWLVGDLINRGPHSLETLRLWRDVGGRAVLGNHEVYAWMEHLGEWPRKEDTLDALRKATDGADLYARLAALPVLVRSEPSDARRHEQGPPVWVVHAGLDQRWTALDEIADGLRAAPRDPTFFTREEVQCATRIRCCTADGDRSRFHGVPSECPPPFAAWDSFYRGPHLVVHGHWAWRGHYRGRHTIGLDSGCVYGGPLTAWSPDSDEVVQVPAAEAGA